MATPKVIERFIKETRRLQAVNISANTGAEHNQLILANARALINLPEPVGGTEIFLKTRTADNVHLIAPPQSTIDGAGQRVSQGSLQSVRLVAGDDTWHKISELGDSFINLDRPSYTLENFSAPTQAEYNDSITGTVDILNEGDIGNELMSLDLDGSVVASQNVELDFNETLNLSLTGTITVLPGTYQLTISSPTASISQQFEVLTPPTFIDIQTFDAPISATSGESIQVDATVNNEGESATDVPIQLFINRGQPDEELVEEKIIDLDFLESRELSYFFEVTATDDVELELVTPDATQAQQLQVSL